MATTTMQRFSQLTASMGMSLPQHSSSRSRKGRTTTGFSLIFDEYDQSYRYNNNYQTHHVLPTEAFIRMERERTADFSFTTHCDDEDEDEEDDEDDIQTTLVVNDDDNTDDNNNKDKDRYIVIATKDILEVTPLVERTNNTDDDDDAVVADAAADDDDSCDSFDTPSACPSAEVVLAATAVGSSAPLEEEKDEQPQQQQLRSSSSSRSNSNSNSNTSRDNNKITMTTTKSLSNFKSTIRMSISASSRRTGSNKNATTNDKSFNTAATTELSFIVDDKDDDDDDDADDYNCYTVLPTEAFITMERVRSSDFSYNDTTTVASYDLTYNNNDENDAIISVFILDTIHANTLKDDDGVGESESDNENEAVVSSYDQQCPYYHQESIETIDGATTHTLARTKYGDDVVRHCSFLASSALIVVSLSLSCIEFEEV